MVALWIRAGCALAGDSALGIRLLGPLAAALGSILLVRAAPDRHTGLIAAALLNATLLLGAGAVTMTPDTPLLLFWTMALWALARVQRTGDGRYWLVAGLATGLATASKYTGVLLLPAALVWLLLTPRLRFWLRRAEPWGGAVLAGLVFFPVLQWNAAHHWISFLRQGGRTGAWHPARAAQFLAELAAGQFGLATPLVFCLCVCGAWAAARRARRDGAAALLTALILLPACVFVQHALGDRVQANWPAIVYPAAAIAAATWCAARWRTAIASGFGVTALVYLQAATFLLPLPPRLDPVQRQLAGWRDLADQAALAANTGGDRFLAADEYGLAAELALLLPHATVIGAEPRWASFALRPAAIAGQRGLLLRSARRAGPPDATPWAAVLPAGSIERRAPGGVVERYLLYRVIGRTPSGDVVALPQPTGG
jgi:4-amino-4-deoxy-L-arabinose transferase-like glycosyltransferase